jgi:hypothetical protein
MSCCLGRYYVALLLPLPPDPLCEVDDRVEWTSWSCLLLALSLLLPYTSAPPVLTA